VPGPLHPTEIHVLAKATHAGDQLILTGFSPDDGLLTALLRLPRAGAPAASPTPDLFDRLALTLEHGRGSPAGGPWFVREHRLLIRHAAIGRSYESLAAASRLARVITRNPGAQDTRAGIDALLTRAFAAFARPAARPDLVFFKSLYVYARDEGLPLKEEWLPLLPPADRDIAAAALALPADAPTAPATADLARLTQNLASYLAAEHDLTVD
jgi:hypothetical protein